MMPRLLKESGVTNVFKVVSATSAVQQIALTPAVDHQSSDFNRDRGSCVVPGVHRVLLCVL